MASTPRPGTSRLKSLAPAVPAPAPLVTIDESRALLKQVEQRLYESFTQILPAWALKAVADPFAYGINTGSAFGTATGTTNDRRGGKDIPLFWNELDLRGYRILSRQICDQNQFGIGFTKLLTAYHVRKGFGWQACLKGQKKSPYATSGANADPLVSKAQGILDQWRTLNHWRANSREAFRRWCRDGEVFGRFFQQGHAKLSTFRFVEPEQIGSPTGNVDDDESFGIATESEDPCCPVAYHVWRMEAGLIGDWVSADRIIHAKKNVDSGIKRGLPDFTPVAEDLDGVRRLLHTMMATAIKQARIARIEKLANATKAIAAQSLPEFVNTATNQLQPSLDGTIARAIADQYGRFGINGQALSDTWRVEGDRQIEAGPTTSPEGFISALQASLRGCGVIWNFPEYFSGDASNNNMASSIVAGAPFVVTVEGSQGDWADWWEVPCALKVLELARDAGLLSWEEWSRLDVEVTEPAVATADPLKDTQVYTQQLQSKIACLDTVRLKLGYDPRHEAEGVQKDAQTAQPQAAGGGGGGDGDGAGSATAAPAPDDDGGDDPLSALTAEQIEEARTARKDGDKWSVGGNHYTKVNGKIRKIADSNKKPKPPSKAELARQAKVAKTDNTAKAKAAADKLAAGGEGLTHEDVQHLDAHFETLTQAAMKDVARKIGAKLSGAKKELAQRLIDHAKKLKAGQDSQVPTAEPTPPPDAPAAPSAPAEEPAAPKQAPAQSEPHAVQRALVTSLNESPDLSDDQREHYGQALARVVRSMPTAALDRMTHRLSGMTFHPSVKAIPQAVVDELAGKPGLSDDERQAVRAKYAHLLKLPIGGAYILSTRRVHVDGANNEGKDAHIKGRHAKGFNQTHGVYAHELTHSIDGPNNEISNSPAWHDAYTSEMDYDADAVMRGEEEPPLTYYAGSKPSEGLAEFGRLVYGSDVPHAQIEKEFPKATAVFKAHGLWPTTERTGDTGAKMPEIFSERVDLGKEGGHADVLKKDTSEPPTAPPGQPEPATAAPKPVKRPHADVLADLKQIGADADRDTTTSAADFRRRAVAAMAGMSVAGLNKVAKSIGYPYKLKGAGAADELASHILANRSALDRAHV